MKILIFRWKIADISHSQLFYSSDITFGLIKEEIWNLFWNKFKIVLNNY